MHSFVELANVLEGELYHGDSGRPMAIRRIYATDASVYQQLPLAVCLPKTKEDIVHLIKFADERSVSLIPRAAGTSLAGQVVGNGIVVDISCHFNAIVEVDKEDKWVRVQPGVIRDDLNAYLRQFGLMFGPETSTANRAMVGGMIGNNSCGLHSIIWGDTRENLLEVTVILANGREVTFERVSKKQYEEKQRLENFEGTIYRGIHSILTDPINQTSIKTGFPKASVKRRNTGYALDRLLAMLEEDDSFNLSSLIAGSEGTLCFIVEAKLQLLPLPPEHVGLVAVHTKSISEALSVNLVALGNQCSASELVDDVILSYTINSIAQAKNRFFIQGDPKAILMVEFMCDSKEALLQRKQHFIDSLKSAGLGFFYPFLVAEEAKSAWDLRKAGLGLLRNEVGNLQPVNVIEDCAVDVKDLSNYVRDVHDLLVRRGLRYSIYAHAGAGELHIEPLIDVKTDKGRTLLREILDETALLVKKYNGSLSGEHGDGRLRGEFIPVVMGDNIYDLFTKVKKLFDPTSVFNKGKIVHAPAMDESTRYDKPTTQTSKNILDFSKTGGILRLAEKCSGSGECRKSKITGGVMCPSFMVTYHERDSTRARANMLRHFYSDSSFRSKKRYEEVNDILDLCLSCKGCKTECPSEVDVGKMKAEFLQQFYDLYGVPFRSWLVGSFTRLMQMASYFPSVYNALAGRRRIRRLINRLIGFHPNRSMPLLENCTLRQWFKKNKSALNAKQETKGTVYLFCDEFTNYHDVSVGKAAVCLLTSLGYRVILPKHFESGRALLSKGLVRKAKKLAIKNVKSLSHIVREDSPLVGIEPSAISSFRDEYLDLVPKELLPVAEQLSKNCFLFEEWLSLQIEDGKVTAEQFIDNKMEILLHIHCHQKVLSTKDRIIKCLSLPANYNVGEIPSGCCGMAGAFGYEKEHYTMSMQVGELVLLPAVRSNTRSIIAASGTSCRHQIKDGTGRTAKHTAEILYDALRAEIKIKTAW